MNPFFFSALLAGSLASITSGIIGSYVVIKRIVFISGSIAHSVLGGMGLALFLQRTYHIPWLSPMVGALAFALLAAFTIGWMHMRHKEREDTAIGALWAAGMALGVIFLSLTPGSTGEILGFLFGNILWITKNDIILLICANILIILFAVFFHRKLLAISFDEDQARLQNVNVKPLYIALLGLIALAVVILIQIVGAILVIAMLSLPAAIAARLTYRLSRMMTIASLLGIGFVAIGLSVAYALNWPPGATIALTSSCAYLLSFIKKNTYA